MMAYSADWWQQKRVAAQDTLPTLSRDELEAALAEALRAERPEHVAAALLGALDGLRLRKMDRERQQNER